MTLDDLARACEAATKGPWEMHSDGCAQVWTPDFPVAFCDTDDHDMIGAPSKEQANLNGTFIALSREAVPKLLAFVKAWDEFDRLSVTDSPQLRQAMIDCLAARKALE